MTIPLWLAVTLIILSVIVLALFWEISHSEIGHEDDTPNKITGKGIEDKYET